jgi:hypothetical protein
VGDDQTKPDLDALRAAYEEDWHKYQYEFNWHLENTRALVQLSPNALRAAALINAGAAVAILAYLGSKAGEGVHIASFGPALAWFAVGIVTATLAAGTAYWAQLWLGSAEERDQQRGRWPYGVTIVLYLAGVLFFGLGCWKTYDVMVADASRETIAMADDSPKNPPPGSPKQPERKDIIAPRPPPPPDPRVPVKPPGDPKR